MTHHLTSYNQWDPFSKFHAHQQPPWFLSDIRHLINHLHTMSHRFRNHPTNPTDDKSKCFWTLTKHFSPTVLHTCASVLCESLCRLLIMSLKYAVISEA